ncbi:MGMT family protein [Chromobacterium sp. IIBBL 290-4]|uniref:MGMT family protein n=1 Tax=Chromobacterium sp. IIBBL 290-4 TaxID=2953890 RepID=UPI0020B7BBF0|nr:MGMT family protein [Chromobacterium sp. IIBBL 290-4]UTH75809.1 MGMT family protein [Chromobacterium sp. IIBBL 290-4]
MPPEFARRVLALLAQVPAGRVITYGELAAQAGFPRHSRHVGRLLGHLPDGVQAPWHRVLGAGGRLSRPGSQHADWQKLLLEEEDVEFNANGKVSLARYGWTDRES